MMKFNRGEAKLNKIKNGVKTLKVAEINEERQSFNTSRKFCDSTNPAIGAIQLRG